MSLIKRITSSLSTTTATTATATAATNHINKAATIDYNVPLEPSTAKDKMLTDFSIASIIGASRQELKLKEEPCHRVGDNGVNNQAANIRLETKNQKRKTYSMKKFRPKNFQCPACKMAFSNNGQLKNHVRIHTGERPFMCNFTDCNKTFTRNEELTRHKLIHSGVRPHACVTCGKRFGRKDHLKKHARTHERKRLRKRAYISALSSTSSSSMATTRSANLVNSNAQNVFMVSKEQALHQSNITTSIFNHENKHIAQTLPDIASNAAMHSTSYQLPISATTISTTFPMPSASFLYSSPPIEQTTTLQQIASDCWNKWYNLIGFYQNQHNYQPDNSCYPPLHSPIVDKLSNIFRKSR